MSRRVCSGYFLVACAAMYACFSFAGPSVGPGAEVKGELTSYVQSKLPLPRPVVVYVYTSSGSLEAVIETHGGYDASLIGQVKAAVDKRDFHSFRGPDLARTATAMSGYLSDQGYRIEEVVNKKMPFTLLLAFVAVKGDACASAMEVRGQYEQAIRDAVEQPSTRGVYALDLFELSSSTLKIECRRPA